MGSGGGVAADVRRPLLTDTGDTRPLVEETLAKLQALHPTSLEAPVFRGAVEQAVHAPHVVTVWLIAPDGRFALAAGGTADSTPQSSMAEELAGCQTRRLLSTLPDDALSAQQRTWLSSAAAIRREGEHNDIFRHMLRPIHDSDGRLVAMVGVAYTASMARGGAACIAAVVVGLAGLSLYWLSLPLWVLLDARQRGDHACAWTAFVLIGNLVALISYLLARPPRAPNLPKPADASG